jgi:hypothetical protein
MICRRILGLGMMEIHQFAERLQALETDLLQVAETLSTLGEASLRGLEQATRTLEAVVEQLERGSAQSEAP